MLSQRIAVLVACIVVAASAQLTRLSPPLISLPDTNKLGLNIDRSLRLLSTNQAIKIVTAGQSIIDGNNQWHVRLIDTLRTKFGNTRITHVARGVGGCATDCQLSNHVSTIAADRPDLIIYYVYGWENYDKILYEINRLCTNDSLEFLILNDHITPPSGDVHGTTYGRYMNDLFLPWMCEKWKAGLCDIRTYWAKYLTDYSYPPARLLSDDVHLNDSGQWLMEDLVERYFVIRGRDVTAPVVDSIVCISPTRIKVYFSEKIERTSALTVGNYTVSGSQATGVIFGGDLRSVFIATSVRAPGQYTVTVSGVRDLAGNAASNTSASAPSVADPGWQSMDIGTCASAGSTTKNESAGTWTLRSSADNTWAYKNEYHYSYKTVYGDFELIAKLTSHGSAPANDAAMAGVCVREVPEYYARNVGLGIRKTGALTYILRENERDTMIVRSGTTRTVPQWFRIRRSGTSITMNYSNDGTTWSNAPTTTWLTTPEVTVGLFALAGNYGSTQTANFTDVALSGGAVGTMPAMAVAARAASVSLRVLDGGRVLALEGLGGSGAAVEVFDGAGRLVATAGVHGSAGRVVLPAGVSSVLMVRVITANGATVKRVTVR